MLTRQRDLAELLLLAALWGAAFLLMRICAPEFGPAALVFVRVGGAALLLVPLAAARGDGAALLKHWRPIAVVGLVNTALATGLVTPDRFRSAPGSARH